MRDYLLDIIKNTFGLGKINLVKISGDTEKTSITGIAEERLFVITARFHNPLPDFIGTFGMPNLNRLNAIVSADEYREGALLTVSRVKNEPENITFKNKDGDFTNVYRFMSSNVVASLVPDISFVGARWHVEFEPSVLSIQRMRSQASINSDQSAFTVRTDDVGLKFKFGDPASLSGEFVFQGDVENKLTGERKYPVQAVLNILSLTGEKTMKISADGVMNITIDTGLGVYEYFIPALSK